MELPKLLDVGSEHIAKQLEALVKKNRSYNIIYDALFNSEYLESVAKELSQLLNERGVIAVTEISSIFDLTTDFISKKLAEWIEEKKIVGTIHGESIYNESHIRREKAKIKGYLLGCSRPVLLEQLMQELKVEERLFDTIILNLVKSKEVKGQLVSNLFVPEQFELSQRKIVITFYQNNHYIKYDFLSKLLIQKPKDYIKALSKAKDDAEAKAVSDFPPGTHLKTAYISNNTIQEIDSAIANAISSEECLDLLRCIPEGFTAEDIEIVLEECPSSKNAIKFGEHFLTNKKVIDNILSDLKSLAAAYVSSVGEEKKSAPAKKKAESKKTEKRKKKGQKEASEAQEEEEKKLDIGVNAAMLAKELKKLPRFASKWHEGEQENESFESMIAGLAESIEVEARN